MEEKPLWMTDETVREIPAYKLEFLEELFVLVKTKDKNTLVPTLLSLLAKAKKENLNLSPSEMQIAMNAIKKYSTPKELEDIDTILSNTKGPVK